jgi:hypothetical protein
MKIYKGNHYCEVHESPHGIIGPKKIQFSF